MNTFQRCEYSGMTIIFSKVIYPQKYAKCD